MARLTFEDFCDIAGCLETRGGSFCEDGACSQRKTWERPKNYEDLEEQGRLVMLPNKAMRLKVAYQEQGNTLIEYAPVVHGRWIPLEYDGYADGNPVWDLWECSECQEEHSGDEDTLTPYCPNCGAKMDSEGE